MQQPIRAQPHSPPYTISSRGATAGWEKEQNEDIEVLGTLKTTRPPRSPYSMLDGRFVVCISQIGHLFDLESERQWK